MAVEGRDAGCAADDVVCHSMPLSVLCLLQFCSIILVNIYLYMCYS